VPGVLIMGCIHVGDDSRSAAFFISARPDIESAKKTKAPVTSHLPNAFRRPYEIDQAQLSDSEESMRAFLKTIVRNKNLLTDDLVKLRNDAVMISGTVHNAPYEPVVSKEIKRMEDLEGKKLGIARFGGSGDFSRARLLRNTG
jgi:hypothetical protein